jgi:hypothetical protein
VPFRVFGIVEVRVHVPFRVFGIVAHSGVLPRPGRSLLELAARSEFLTRRCIARMG